MLSNILKLVGVLFIVIAVIVLFFESKENAVYEEPRHDFVSIDTMKYSRDLAREKIDDDSFDQTIDLQLSSIAQTGATHVSIGTPYDEEFLPYMKRWVTKARKYNLNIWFRGNFSGWEQWFEYDPITPDEHLTLTEQFIRDNFELFEDGDIFTPCSECENGSIGDPRETRKISEYRTFLRTSYSTSKQAFDAIGKSVSTGYFSMNYDVAQLIMDRETTNGVGGIVVIDHYVSNPEVLVAEAIDIANSTGGKVVLGEFGAPIPDIHGEMSDEQQREWVGSLFDQLDDTDVVIGMNYWTSYGGSTRLWENDGTPRKAAEVVSNYYHNNTVVNVNP